MVLSKLNSNVIYQETKKIDSEDRGVKACLYEIDIFEKQVVITLGKLKYTFANKHIVYVPIYLVNPDNTIDAQIGIYEFEDNLVMKIMDDEGDIDITYMSEPLLYDFSETVIIKTKSDVIEYLSKWEKPTTDIVVDTTAIATSIAEDSDDDDDENDIMKLKIPKMVKSKQMEKAVELIETGIFTTNTKLQQQPNVLAQETELEADEIQQNFKESSKNTWIQKYMKNPHYEIHEVEANGDCFFAVVRDAFKQIGQITTVPHLRAILAREITDKIFQDYRSLFTELDSMIKRIDSECATIKKILDNDLKLRMKNTKKLSDQQAIKKEVDDLKEQFMELRSQRKEIKDTIAESLGDISQITTFEQFREYIQTSRYWADAWSISTLERVLNIKMIIFSEQAYIDGAINSVLNCGEVNVITQAEGKFSPNYYIMTAYSGNHYRLISYKSKKMLSFGEIPYHIKNMIINKCFERNSGIYYLIEDFRNFKSKLGIEPDVGGPLEEEDTQEYSDLYDPDTTLMFHAKSENKAKPGKGSGEVVPNDKISSFVNLGKMPEWRRKLDSAWTNSPFKIDGHSYSSVLHYYQGSKFKHGFPDFAMLFSLDSKSKISEDVVLARAAGGKSGKNKNDILRPKTVIIDPDFYPTRNKLEYAKALRAKFTQHPELAQVLIETKKAKLVHYIARNPPEVDIELIKLRSELTKSI